jgi:hypothetical protein
MVPRLSLRGHNLSLVGRRQITRFVVREPRRGWDIHWFCCQQSLARGNYQINLSYEMGQTAGSLRMRLGAFSTMACGAGLPGSTRILAGSTHTYETSTFLSSKRDLSSESRCACHSRCWPRPARPSAEFAGSCPATRSHPWSGSSWRHASMSCCAPCYRVAPWQDLGSTQHAKLSVWLGSP